jgi:hypothetical protein
MEQVEMQNDIITDDDMDYAREEYFSVDEREDEDGRLDSWENHLSMVEACDF